MKNLPFIYFFWLKLNLMGLVETKSLKITPSHGKCSPAAFRIFAVDFKSWSLNVSLSLPHFTVIKNQLNDTFKWNQISQNVVPFLGKIWFLLSNSCSFCWILLQYSKCVKYGVTVELKPRCMFYGFSFLC